LFDGLSIFGGANETEASSRIRSPSLTGLTLEPSFLPSGLRKRRWPSWAGFFFFLSWDLPGIFIANHSYLELRSKLLRILNPNFRL
jgi:hypothetical protein